MDNSKFITLISVFIVCSIIIMITLILTRPTSIKMPDNNIVFINEAGVKDTVSAKVIKLPIKNKGKRHCPHKDIVKRDTTVLIFDSASVVRIKNER